MKKLIVIMMLALMSGSLMAQEYKLAKSSGKLVIKELNNVTLEGHSGNEIIFTSLDYSKDRDKRAEGLRAISSMGIEDNTGIGLSVQDKGDVIEVYQLRKMDGPRIKILVPKGVTVSVSHSSPYGNDVKIRNIESEIEISTVHNSVQLDNVTGPMTVKTVHGNIETNFNATIKSPISIVSVHGFVDVTVPAATKASLNISTSYGEVFVDPAIKIDFEEQGDWTKYGSKKIKGKVNGGGIDFTLSSTHNSIYLRKK